MAKKSQTVKALTAFSSETCDVLRTEVNAAVASIAEKYGITLRVGRITYDTLTTNLKLEATVQGAQQTKEREAWKLYAKAYGLDPAWLDRMYVASKGQIVKIDGLISGRGTPKVAVTVDGKEGYNTSIENVKVNMSADPEAARKAAEAEKEKISRVEWKGILACYGQGLPKYGTEIVCLGKTYTVIGADKKGKKTTVVTETADGVVFRFPAGHPSVIEAMSPLAK